MLSWIPFSGLLWAFCFWQRPIYCKLWYDMLWIHTKGSLWFCILWIKYQPLKIMIWFEKKKNPYSIEKSCACLFGFLRSSSTTRLYRGRAPRQSIWQFYVLPHMRQSWETMTSVLAGHIILIPTQPVGSGRPQQESKPRPLHQESHTLPTELPRPPPPPPKPVPSHICFFFNYTLPII